MRFGSCRYLSCLVILISDFTTGKHRYLSYIPMEEFVRKVHPIPNGTREERVEVDVTVDSLLEESFLASCSAISHLSVP